MQSSLSLKVTDFWQNSVFALSYYSSLFSNSKSFRPDTWLVWTFHSWAKSSKPLTVQCTYFKLGNLRVTCRDFLQKRNRTVAILWTPDEWETKNWCVSDVPFQDNNRGSVHKEIHKTEAIGAAAPGKRTRLETAGGTDQDQYWSPQQNVSCSCVWTCQGGPRGRIAQYFFPGRLWSVLFRLSKADSTSSHKGSSLESLTSPTGQ